MAFPPVPANLSDQESIQAILEAESGIIDCMAAFFCGPGGVVELVKGGADIAEKIELFSAILPAYANKENSIANVMVGAAEKLAADKNIDPALVTCPAACK
ncbi:hypothetical protein [Clostridium sp. B9]|uniref:hypothetical protein n=1 Tax=Clostridium sp. B9 TaxID=3423224 RepID=UPI003D2EBE47